MMSGPAGDRAAIKFSCVIFDLDDTLFDSTGTLQAPAVQKVVESLAAQASCPFGEAEAREAFGNFERSFGSRRNLCQFLNELVSLGKLSQEGAQQAKRAYNAGGGVDTIELFEGAAEVLKEVREVGLKIGIITSGDRERQLAKVNQLGLEALVDAVVIDTVDSNSASRSSTVSLGTIEECIARLRALDGGQNCSARSCLVVGDRVHGEIKQANILGCVTARLRHGKYSTILPATLEETPDYDISKLGQVPGLLSMPHSKQRVLTKVVALGGGTGLSSLLGGLREFGQYSLTGIVTVFDSGRHTGKLRQQTALPAMGDIRKTIASLSEAGELMQQLVEFRFRGEQYGEMDGACLGNLILAALTELQGGDFGKGVAEASQILKLGGVVLPVTLESTQICAELEDGTKVCKETQVRRVGTAEAPKAPIRRVFLGHEEPESGRSESQGHKKVVPNTGVRAHEAALAAINDADFIILSPGSFYTSIIANLIVPGIAEAIMSSRGKVVYIANLTTQPGQTDGLDFEAHLGRLSSYLMTRDEGRCEAAGDDIWTPFDYVIANEVDREPSDGAAGTGEGCSSGGGSSQGSSGGCGGGGGGGFDGEVIFPNETSRANPKLVVKDIMQRGVAQEWNKAALLRHDPQKLASILHGIIALQTAEPAPPENPWCVRDH
jgi:uncharacterized cofD-like protein